MGPTRENLVLDPLNVQILQPTTQSHRWSNQNSFVSTWLFSGILQDTTFFSILKKPHAEKLWYAWIYAVGSDKLVYLNLKLTHK